MILEPIDKALTLVGDTLTFTGFTIKGIPGFSINLLHRGEDVIKSIEVPMYNFRISTADSLAHNIVKDMTFTYTDRQNTFVFTFKTESNPIPDLTGWSRLNVNYISKTAV